MKSKVVLSNAFKRDLKVAEKRGLNLDLLNETIDKIASGEKLSEKFKDHALSGNYNGFRECHVEPDWLLIYRLLEEEVMLFLLRTGTHSDLFR